MSLPFLKKKDQGNAGLIIKTRAPDEDNAAEDQDDPTMGHLACAHDLMTAIKAGNAQGVADALYDAFTLMDSEPHEEGQHIDPHSYHAQNIKAGMEE